MTQESVRERTSWRSVMDKRRFDAGGKSATLYMADSENRPLIVLNNYAGDGEAVMAAVSRFLSMWISICSMWTDWTGITI